jgi:hypothetical protein
MIQSSSMTKNSLHAPGVVGAIRAGWLDQSKPARPKALDTFMGQESESTGAFVPGWVAARHWGCLRAR